MSNELLSRMRPAATAVAFLAAIMALSVSPRVAEADDEAGCPMRCEKISCNLSTGICTGENCTFGPCKPADQ